MNLIRIILKVSEHYVGAATSPRYRMPDVSYRGEQFIQ